MSCSPAHRRVGAPTIAVGRRVVPSPQAPRRQIVELHAGRLDREDRGQETEDQEHRDRDQERSPDGRDGDLARGCVHGCVHAGETPCRRMLFHPGIRNPMGISSGVDAGLR